MKKNFLFLFALLILTGTGVLGSLIDKDATDGGSIELASSSTPGDGFESGEPCGYLTGVAVSPTSVRVRINADGVPDVNQACVNESGYFYSATAKKSYVYIYNTAVSPAVGPYVVDLAYPSADKVVIDQTYGTWSGKGKIISGPGIASMNTTVWFDWTCASDSACAGMDPSSYYVKTDMSTGDTSGLAYNDSLGFVSFNDMSLELPPATLNIYVDVLSSLGAAIGSVDYTNAPIADGYDYWRVRTQFEDGTGVFLDESDVTINYIDVRPVNGSRIYLNQVTNEGDAVYVTAENTTFGCTSTDSYCAQTEDGNFTANKYVSSASPTSNMLGINDDSDPYLDGFTDRDGCVSIYADQIDMGTTDGSGEGCVYSEDKDTVFFDRSSDRNKYQLDYVAVQFTYNDDRSVSGDGLTCSADNECTYIYDFDDTSGALSFRPRYLAEKFVASYDGGEYTTISSDMDKEMSLVVDGVVSDASSYYQSVNGSSAARRPFYVHYQMDADTDVVPDVAGPDDNNYLITDGSVPPDDTADCTFRTDTAPVSYGVLWANYARDYVMNYGQRLRGECGLFGVDTISEVTNTLTNPTAEQWVCDDVPTVKGRFGGQSCYYTSYLPRVDSHADVLSMSIFGSVNSLLDADDALSESDDVSILGASDTIDLRNKMYAQIARYTLGQNAGSGTLNDDMEPNASSIKSLLNDKLLYANGDVIVNGSTGFVDKTLVTIGGDVYIDGNITGGRLGIVALRSNGVGGNVYVDPSVTDLYVNLFLDGSLFSNSKATMDDSITPLWTNSEERLQNLQNQLYINGSLVSRNTINGSLTSPYQIGDGSTTEDYEMALEYDLSYMRQYRLCYPLDEFGMPDDSLDPVECNDGELLSTTYASKHPDEEENYSPLIIEYAPANNLPVFKVDTGLFN